MASICSVVLNSVSSDARVLKQADTLARAGHRVTIVGTRDRGHQAREETLAGGVRLVRCDYPSPAARQGPAGRIFGRLGKAQGMLAMLRAIRGVRPQVLHCHDVYTLPLGPLAKLLMPCRLVYDAHEIYEGAAGVSPAQARRFRRIHRACAGWCDGFVTINRSIADWHQRHYPRLPRAEIVMNAARQQETIRYDGRLHRAAGLPPEVSILLVQGGLKAHRGLPEVARAAGYLPPGWAVVMMGNGELGDSLETTARELGAHGDGIPRLAVIPAAPLAELPFWTAGAAIGLIPYENQGINHWFCTPNKLWEYPCAGVPVLASPFPEMQAMIARHGFGWLLAPDWDGPAMAAQVAGLEPEDLARRRERCAEFMARENWDKYGARLLNLYERLLS